MKTIQHKHITWIDIEKPTKNDLKYLKDNFDFHSLILDEIPAPTIRSKVEEFPTYLYLVLHFPVYNKKTKENKPFEIDFLITRTHIITSHLTNNFPPLADFFKKLEKEDEAQKRFMNQTTGHLLYYLVNFLISACIPSLDHISQKIDTIEAKIFKGHQKEMVEEISLTKRDLLDFRRIIKPQKTILESLLRRGPLFFGEYLKPYFEDLIGSNDQIWNQLENDKETLESLAQTNDSLLSYKLNETMKILTIFATLLLPATLLTGLFGMNIDDMPIVKSEFAFWIIIIIIVTILSVFLLFFKKKKVL